MSRLGEALKSIVDVFVQYAGEDGQLNEEELKKLFESEMAAVDCKFKEKFSGGNFNRAMGRMDKDRNGQINFEEYMRCVGMMARCCYRNKAGKDQECD